MPECDTDAADLRFAVLPEPGRPSQVRDGAEAVPLMERIFKYVCSTHSGALRLVRSLLNLRGNLCSPICL